MSVHLIKLCVGIDDVGHLQRAQALRMEEARRRGETPVLRHVTRNTPRRAAEVVDGGSLYWVIRRVIRVRQRITAIEPWERDDGKPACALILDPQLVRTHARTFRPFQGWRYFPTADAPADLSGRDDLDGVPAEMAAELRGLGLL